MAADDICTRPSVKDARAEARLEALGDLFASEGFQAFTIGDLAARIRCSKRSLYELAPTKKALVLRVLSRRFEKVRENGDAAVAGHQSPPDRIRAYLQVGVASSQRSSAAYSRDINGDPDTAALFDDHQRRRTEGLGVLIAEGIEQGHFQGFHPYLVAEVMMAAVYRLRQPDFLARAGISMGDAFEELSRLILGGVGARRD